MVIGMVAEEEAVIMVVVQVGLLVPAAVVALAT